MLIAVERCSYDEKTGLTSSDIEGRLEPAR